MDICFLEKSEDFQSVLDILLQLRPQYTFETLEKQINRQQKQGYNIVYVKLDNEVLAVAGFFIGEKLAWGKHIYIADLVTNESCRSKGVGAFLINWFKEYCRELGCTQLHLDSGIQKFSAHRFYLRERFNIASHHFSTTNMNS